jgi:hypothetical protein
MEKGRVPDAVRTDKTSKDFQGYKKNKLGVCTTVKDGVIPCALKVAGQPVALSQAYHPFSSFEIMA